MNVETEIIKNEYATFKRNEEMLHQDIDVDTFFSIIADLGYDYKTISSFMEGGIYESNEQQEFNIALRNMKYYFGIDISDSILYIEETIPLQNILRFIDEGTRSVLTEEMEEKYSMSSDKDTKVMKFLYKK